MVQSKLCLGIRGFEIKELSYIGDIWGMNMLNWFKRQEFVIIPVGLMMVLVIGLSVFTIPVAALNLPTSCNDATNEVLWCGAATPQQVEADYIGGDGHNSAISIQNIYSAFDISSADINSMQATAVAGSVTKSGNVIVNGNIVATNALTAGRQSIPGSTAETYNGTTFYERPPSVSFLADSLTAFVVMTGNHFDFAILSSCGNPVVGTATTPLPTPVPTSPNYTITKTVSYSGSNQFLSDVQVAPNTLVIYKIVVTSTGTATVNNLVVKDTMPNDDTYNPNTFSINLSPASTSDANSFFNGGLDIGELAPGASDTFMYTAIAGANDNNPNCTNQTLPNVASIQANNLPEESSTAVVSLECPTPTPTTTSPSSTTPPTVTTTSTTPTPTPTQLVNTGPGDADTIAIFIGVSIVGAIGYGIYLRRKQFIK